MIKIDNKYILNANESCYTLENISSVQDADLKITQKNIEKEILNLKQNGLYEIYKNITYEEWEKLEKKTDEEILHKYLAKSKIYQQKAFLKMIDMFKEDLTITIRQFIPYDYKKEDFNRDYMQKEDYEGEEWKKVGQLNYEISNYGRIKNLTTKKLKKLKHQPYGMQVLLWQNSKSYTITISRLVAEFFIRHLEENEKVVHINKNSRDNYYKNLKIVSK